MVPMGDESKKEWAPSPGGKRTSAAIGLRAPLLLPPSPLAPHCQAAALDPAATKAGLGCQSVGRSGRRWEGRVRLRAAAASSPSPSRGLSHGPPPWVGGLGVGVWTPGFSGATDRSGVRDPGGRERRARGGGGKRGAGSQVPRGVVGSEAPPPLRAPPGAPFPLPIVLRQSGRRPPPGPQVSVSVPPPRLPLSLLLLPLFPSLLSPDLPRSSLLLFLSPLSRRQAPPHPLPWEPRSV